MGPYVLIIMGIIVYFLNRNPGMQIGIRGIPGLDPTVVLVGTGLVLLGIKRVLRKRKREREARRSAGEF